MGKIVRMIAENGSVACYAIETTDMVGKAQEIHHTTPVATAALGRLMTAASLIGAELKGQKDTVTLRIAADGPLGAVIAVSDSSGNVKGYVSNPAVELPLNSHGKLDVSGAVGKNGSLYVIKDLGLKEPHIGMTPLVSGEIAEDVTNFFAVSEQIPTVCALGVLVNHNSQSVRKAGGFIAQLLPGAMEEDICRLEENIKELPAVTKMLDEGKTPQEIGEIVMKGFAPQLLDIRDVAYRCDCTAERVHRALESLSADELQTMADEDNGAEVCCHFCNQKYQFSKDDLLSLIEEKKQQAEEDSENE